MNCIMFVQNNSLVFFKRVRLLACSLFRIFQYDFCTCHLRLHCTRSSQETSNVVLKVTVEKKLGYHRKKS